MPTPPAGFLDATFIFTLVGSNKEMTWTCGWNDASFNATTAAEEAHALYDAFTGTGKPYAATNLVTGWSFAGVSVTHMLESGPTVGEWRVPVAGSAASTTAPPNVAILFRKNTALGGRRNRGRFYHPPCSIAEGSIDNVGVITTSVISQQQGFFNSALTSAATAGLTPVLFHVHAPFTPTSVNGFTLLPTVATQRRRLR